MKTVYKHKSAVWVDLVEPTAEEIEELSREYALDPLVSYELITPSLKYRIEPKRDQLFLIMHLPAFKETATLDSEVGFKDSKEIDIVVGKNFLITVRYEEIDAVERFAKKVEVESILDKETPVNSRELLFFGLFKELSQGLFNQLAYIDGWLKEIEADMFKGREKEMVSSLSEASRHLINFKNITMPYLEIVRSLEVSGEEKFGRDFGYFARDLSEEFTKFQSVLAGKVEMVSELRETNNSMLSTKQNEIMKTLTIMAFVTFPLSLIASIFGMNTDWLPIVGLPNDFWIVAGIMGVMMLCFFAFFKYRKWL